MDENQALEQAKAAANQRSFRLSRHAREQMAARSVRMLDVLESLWSATHATFQPEGGRNKWKLEGGRDRDGDELVVVVEFCDDGGTRVVTVF